MKKKKPEIKSTEIPREKLSKASGGHKKHKLGLLTDDPIIRGKGAN